MRRLVALVTATLWAVTIASAAFAYPEWVEEVWRSPYGENRFFGVEPVLAPSPSDRSFWMIEGAAVAHYAADATMLSRSQPLYTPWVLAADPADGSCWVLQATKDELLHFDADGRLLSATPGPSYRAILLPSPADGSVWIDESGRVTHVDASGTAVWAVSGEAWALAADPEDGSLWIVEGSDLVRRAADGSELWRLAGFGAEVCVGEDVRDQSVWAGSETGRFTHISATGQILSEHGGPRRVLRVAVLSGDGSLWVQYSSNPDNPGSPEPADREYVARLDPSGTELFRKEYSGLWFVNLHDGSVWIRGPYPWDTTFCSANGQVLGTMGEFMQCQAFDPVDSSYWATGRQYSDTEPILDRRAADGTLLWSQLRPSLWRDFWVDPSDGSCWTRSAAGPEARVLVKWSPTGEPLGSRTIPDSATSSGEVVPLAFDANGQTWWGQDGGALLHIGDDGTVLWRQESVIEGYVRGFGISPVDASVWLASGGAPPFGHTSDTPLTAHLAHLAGDGTVLSATDYAAYVWCLSFAADGSFWVSTHNETGGKLVRFSSAGEAVAELPLPEGLAEVIGLQVRASDGSLYGSAWSGETFMPTVDRIFRMTGDGVLLWQVAGYTGMGLVPQDGSVWATSLGEGQVAIPEAPNFSLGSAVAHLSADGQCLWRGETFSAPGRPQINAYDGTPWVYDYDNRQLVHLQVAPLPFADVPADFWAFDAIAACVEAGIVQGYGDNTYRPEQPVTRDQMAVYIARGLAGSDEAVTVPTGVTEPTFTDVGEDHWAYRYIEYCVGANIVEGYPHGGYHPGTVVNRGQMAVYIARTMVTPSGDAAVPDPPDEPAFPDVTADNECAWCYPHVAYCAAEGVVQGYWDGTYRPQQAVTRDQMAVFVARAFGLDQG
jgi:hypothetical protein